jgi:oxalate---CoA ligase
LRDFIVGFYTVDATHPQKIDDSFCAFVWSLIVQQSTVRVGIIPSGAATEVYIATQTSAKRKAEAKGEEIVEEQVSTLDVVPDASTRSLDDLKAQYGDDLRIAVDPDTSFAAITGSHLRVCSSP